MNINCPDCGAEMEEIREDLWHCPDCNAEVDNCESIETAKEKGFMPLNWYIGKE